ncbi:MAG TPA: DUF4166 domain-containing protein [Accumulibacter sp.]|nr:DUF4166 domain-containing protein [Accumulibacter sp.]HMW18364.1 DUF4166 domain-containing protein [Accumulibacter sp.]HMX22263.1 DUF4166 domain-containing protein [Accumulibacter sp.]HNC16499.1 DUF4166 domain-containing protein [Accumulibacter sp.]HNG37435.1 DUF4166 domain-containing protein [Accumulibacter sp.]
MQRALGDDWQRLPAALQAHYQVGPNVDIGCMDIEFPMWMKPYLWLLHRFGALLPRSGKHIPTRVEKNVVGERQFWRRTMHFPDGRLVTFNSVWVPGDKNHLIEFVNPMMGLEMTVRVEGNQLRYEGVRFVLKWGRLVVGLPEWLILGHTTIVEHGLSENTFAMDFRLTHPFFGQVFRYAGTFATESRQAQDPASMMANPSCQQPRR